MYKLCNSQNLDFGDTKFLVDLLAAGVKGYPRVSDSIIDSFIFASLSYLAAGNVASSYILNIVADTIFSDVSWNLL